MLHSHFFPKEGEKREGKESRLAAGGGGDCRPLAAHRLVAPTLLLLLVLGLCYALWRGGRQLSAGPSSRGQPPVDSVQAERDRVKPFTRGDQSSVEGGEEVLRGSGHKDAADARCGKAVAAKERVKVAHGALEQHGAGQQRLLHGVLGGGEELLVLLNDGDALVQAG